MYECMHVRTYVRTNEYMYICKCIYIYVVCVYIYIYLRRYIISMYIYIHIRTYQVYIYVICMYRIKDTRTNHSTSDVSIMFALEASTTQANYPPEVLAAH
jgi:hypothetical protein